MTKECKSVLEDIRKFTNYSDTQFGYVCGEDAFCLDGDTDNLLYYTQYANEISSIMDSLMDEGYVVHGFNEYHFHLSHKGIHKDQYSRQALHMYLRDNWISIFALILSVVAFIRTL